MKNETAMSVVAKAIVDDSYRRGFEAAKAAALKAARDVKSERITTFGRLACDDIIELIEELTPEVTQ